MMLLKFRRHLKGLYGAEVKPGDILVGKITPKSETELAPEDYRGKANTNVRFN